MLRTPECDLTPGFWVHLSLGFEVFVNPLKVPSFPHLREPRPCDPWNCWTNTKWSSLRKGWAQKMWFGFRCWSWHPSRTRIVGSESPTQPFRVGANCSVWACKLPMGLWSWERRWTKVSASPALPEGFHLENWRLVRWLLAFGSSPPPKLKNMF